MKHAFILLQRVLPQHLLSRLVALVGNSKISIVKNMFIRIFIRAFHVNMNEAARDVTDYASFNEFFTRALKEGTRPIAGAACSPADGTVSMAGNIDGNQLLQAKGVSYSLQKLLAGRTTPSFEGGSFATIYLSPKDYHRVHLPVAGTLRSSQYVPGKLFSVNNVTAQRVPDLFAVNERLILWFDTQMGDMAVILVGAMIVAGIKTVWRNHIYPPRQHELEVMNPPVSFNQGDEIGHFEMGSTVIVLFQRQVQWQIAAGQTVRMGEAIV